MKVKCIKRYSDICLKEIVEKGTVLEVTENRDTVPEEKIGKDIEDMTVEELKTLAKEKGLTGVSSLAKADLLDLKEIKVQLALKVLQERLAKELNPQL